MMNLADCSICSQLADHEYGFQKVAYEQENIYLPAAERNLVLVKDVRGEDGRHSFYLKRCPQCGTYYSYKTVYEYLVYGSEDEEWLDRLTHEQADEYLP